MISFHQRLLTAPIAQVAVLYATFGLFLLELAADILELAPQVRLGPFQPQDLALVMCVGYLALINPRFWETLTSKTSLAFLLAVGTFTGIGIVLGNDLGWIRTDLRFFLWFYGGLAFLSLWWQLPRPTVHLHFMQAALVVLLYFSAQEAHSTHFDTTTFHGGEDRLYGLNLFAVGTTMLYFLALHYTVFATQSRLARLSAAVLTAIFFYYVLYLSATRNLMLAYIAMAAACAPVFLYRLGDGFFERRILVLRLTMALIAIVGVGVFAWTRAENLLIIERFEGGDVMSDDSARGRVVELQRALHDFDDQQLITGAGMGETFRPSYMYEANFLHFGIAGLVLKLGLPVGLLTAAALYVGLPLLLLWAFLAPRTFSAPVRTAIYVATPLLFPWLVQLGISGGFTPTHSMGAGMALGVALNSRRTGLDFSFDPEVRRFAPAPLFRTA